MINKLDNLSSEFGGVKIWKCENYIENRHSQIATHFLQRFRGFRVMKQFWTFMNCVCSFSVRTLAAVSDFFVRWSNKTIKLSRDFLWIENYCGTDVNIVEWRIEKLEIISQKWFTIRRNASVDCSVILRHFIILQTTSTLDEPNAMLFSCCKMPDHSFTTDNENYIFPSKKNKITKEIFSSCSHFT